MKRKDWRYRTLTERRLSSTLNRPTKAIKFIVKNRDTLSDIIQAILNVTETDEWKKLAWNEARRMVSTLAVENARTWREAARKSSRSYEIHLALKKEFANKQAFHNLIQKNAELISSMPQRVAEEVTRQAATEAIAGRRAESLIEFIKQKAPQISESHARLIARTEIAKTQAAITQTRAQALGLNWFVWRTCEDQRVRSSHKHMNGVICNYQDLPSPELLDPDTPTSAKRAAKHYGPGNIYNCRCYSEPIIDLDLVTFPAKVAKGNQEQRMNKKQFELIQ